MNNKKKKNQEKILVIGVSVVVILVGVFFVAFKMSGTSTTQGTNVVLNNSGEASVVNFQIPSKDNVKIDSSSIIKQYEQFRRDSINRANINDSKLGNLFGNKGANSKLSNAPTVSENDIELEMAKYRAQKNKSSKKTTSSSGSKSKKSYGGGTKKSKTTYRPKTAVNSKPVAVSNVSNVAVSTISDKEARKKAWLEKSKSDDEAFFNSSASSNNLNAASNSESSFKNDDLIYAVVYGNQKIYDGGRVTMRLARNAVIDGVIHKRNTIFFGFARFDRNRVYVDVSVINDIPSKLKAYDTQDQSLGIHTETNLTEELKNDAENSAINDIPTSRVPFGSIAKSLLRKKKGDKAIPFPNEYKITLKP